MRVWPATVTLAPEVEGGTGEQVADLCFVHVPDTGPTAGQVEVYRWKGPDDGGFAELVAIDPGPLVRTPRVARRQWDTPAGMLVVRAQHCGCSHPLASFRPPPP